MPHVSPGPAAAGIRESSEDAGEQRGCGSDTRAPAKPPARFALQASLNPQSNLYMRALHALLLWDC